MAPARNSAQYAPPEGGWGWFVVLAYSLNNMFVISTLQVFGLLYQDYLKVLNMSVVQISIITTLNSSFGMLIAIFNGPVLKILGFRKVAIVGALTVFVGNYFTSQANSFLEFLLFFSILVSIGTDLVMAAFHLALNTYFVEKRGIATGVAMSVTGIGPIIMPLVTSSLMKIYGISGTGMILSAVCLHSLVAALLLQPVKWHQRKIKTTEEGQNIGLVSKNEDEPNAKIEENTEPEQNNKENDQTLNKEQNKENDQQANEDDISAHTKLMEKDSTIPDTVQNDIEKVPSPESELLEESKRPTPKTLDDVIKRDRPSITKRIAQLFDLDLLRDPIYLNITAGLSLAYVGEMTFSLMLPFILGDRQFDTTQIAILMSIIAGADMLSRFISPFLCRSVKTPVRLIYLAGLISGILIRICLVYFSGFTATVIISFGLGISKGVRSIYTALVIPGYVQLNKLASATGFQMVLNGILLLVFGPLLGIIRDQNKNYDKWIHVINCFGIVTTILWCTEIYLIREKKKKSKTTPKKTPIVKNVTPR